MPSKTPLIHPREYFETESGTTRLGLLVFAIHLFGTVALMFGLIRLLLSRTRNLPERGVSAVYELLIATSAIGVVVSIISLLTVAAIMHYLSSGDDLEGSFEDTLGVAAWSYAPNILAIPIDFGRAWYALSQRTLDGSDPQRFAAELETLQGATGLGDALLAFGIVTWSVYILAHGAAGTHRVELGETIGPALLIGIGSIVLRFV